MKIKSIEGYLPREIPKIKKEEKEYPIYPLYESSKYLSQIILYKIINRLNVKLAQLNKKCVMILLDCSLYINDDKKIYNLFILCAITMALNSLNISYSIGLFGDDKFKIILKQYEEKHSLLFLQLVYECLMLKRWRSNLASTIEFGIKSNLFSKTNFYEQHPERIIYIISDGLDEELLLIKEWKKFFKINNKINFGFLFNLPEKIIEILNKHKIKFIFQENINNVEKEDIYIETFFQKAFLLI